MALNDCSSDVPILASFVCLTELELNGKSRMRRAAEFDGESTSINVQGSILYHRSFPRSKRIKGRHTPHVFALLFGDDQSADGFQIYLHQRKDVAVGHREQGQISVISAINPHRSSHQTRDAERKAGRTAGIFSASQPSRGLPETRTVVHRADDTKVQLDHSFP